MAIKKMERAFKYIRFSKSNLKHSIQWGDRLRQYGDLKWVKTNSPDVEVGYNSRYTMELDFYIFFKGKCIGNVMFDYGEADKPLRALFKGRKVAIPHTGFFEAYRGLGYPSMIYGLALKKGTVLVSDHHTPDAAKLWERVAQKCKAKIAYVGDESGWKLTPEPTSSFDWKVMYL